MSSARSPSIEFDCRPPLAVQTAVVPGICVAATVPLLVDRNPWTFVALVTGVALALLACVWSGWLGGARVLRRAAWTSEGAWWLTDGRGEPFQARLLADSRVFAHWLWLRWDSPAGRRQALLPRRSFQSDAVRRLAVRLRIEGAARQADPDAPLP